jgi:hypothetical protein
MRAEHMTNEHSQSKHFKKARERFLLENFLRCAAIECSILEEREAPDFIVGLGDQQVGVEVTELFVPHDSPGAPLQAQESAADRIVNQARLIYERDGGQPAWVRVLFKLRHDLTRLNRAAAAQELALFVRDLEIQVGLNQEIRPGYPGSPFAEAIASIRVLGVPSNDMGHWTVPRVGWPFPIAPEPIQARIDDKALQLDSYREVVSTNWLVVVADATRPSQLFTARNPEFDATSIKSPFDRTFFFGYPERDLIEFLRSPDALDSDSLSLKSTISRSPPTPSPTGSPERIKS